MGLEVERVAASTGALHARFGGTVTQKARRLTAAVVACPRERSETLEHALLEETAHAMYHLPSFRMNLANSPEPSGAILNVTSVGLSLRTTSVMRGT